MSNPDELIGYKFNSDEVLLSSLKISTGFLSSGGKITLSSTSHFLVLPPRKPTCSYFSHPFKNTNSRGNTGCTPFSHSHPELSSCAHLPPHFVFIPVWSSSLTRSPPGCQLSVFSSSLTRGPLLHLPLLITGTPPLCVRCGVTGPSSPRARPTSSASSPTGLHVRLGSSAPFAVSAITLMLKLLRMDSSSPDL